MNISSDECSDKWREESVMGRMMSGGMSTAMHSDDHNDEYKWWVQMMSTNDEHLLYSDEYSEYNDEYGEYSDEYSD